MKTLGSRQGHDTNNPIARTNDLVVTETDTEMLVYDNRTHHIHHLNSTAKLIYRLADGSRSVWDLQRELGAMSTNTVSEESVQFALTVLSDANLLENPLSSTLRLSSKSRRAFLKKMAAAGVVTPAIIASTSAPTAADSHSQDSGCDPLPEGTGAGLCYEDCHCGGLECVGGYRIVGQLGECL